MLKGRWKRLSYVDVRDPERAKLITTAACVLHNFCIKHNDIFHGDAGDLDDGNNDGDDDDDDDTNSEDVVASADGPLKRQMLMRTMRNIRQ